MEYIIDNSIDNINKYIKAGNRLIFNSGRYEFIVGKECYLKITASGGQGGDGGKGADMDGLERIYKGGYGGKGAKGAKCVGNIHLEKGKKITIEAGKKGLNGSNSYERHPKEYEYGDYGKNGNDGSFSRIVYDDKKLFIAKGGYGGYGGYGAYYRGVTGGRDGKNGSDGNLDTSSINNLEDAIIEQGVNVGDGKIIIEIIECTDVKYLLKQDNRYYTINENKEIIETENNIVTDGFENEALITEELLKTKFNNLNEIKLLMWTNDKEKTEATMTYELKNSYRPIDILKKNNDGKFDIVMKEII